MKKLEEMTQNEKKLRAIICDYRNDFIGGFKNLLSDNGEEEAENYWPLHNRTKQHVCVLIYRWVMNGKDRYLQSPTRNIAIEAKHVHFLGEKFIRELIEDRVDYNYRKNGWAFDNMYDAVNPKDEAYKLLNNNVGKFYKFQKWKRSKILSNLKSKY